MLAWSERLERVVRALARVATVAVLALVVLVTANVVARYAFAGGTVWLQELEWHLLAPIALFGMAYTLATGDHVRVDMLYERFPPKVQHAVDLFAALVGIVVCILLVKFSVPYVLKSFGTLEGSPDPGGLSARYALKALIPLGFVLLLVQFVAMGLRHAAHLRRRTDRG